VGTCRIRDPKDWIMAEADHLKELKSAARKIARARRIKHVGALEVIAKAMGHAHWNALTVAEKKGWRPSTGDIDAPPRAGRSREPLDLDRGGP
jgi:hypothetical protein